MNTEILIVSHAKDAEWLKHCLRSIRKFARGFHQTTVVVPRHDQAVFAELCRSMEARMALFDQVPQPRSHLHHNIVKCRADEYCPGADFICHVDSDCIFRENVTPENYFVDGKAILLHQTYASLERQFPSYPWRSRVEKALHEKVSQDFMRRHPMVNPKAVYGATRQAVVRAQDVDFDRYVLAQKPDYPSGFCEFNTIGQVAWTQFHDAYYWIDVEKEPYPRSKLIQFWGHGGLDAKQNIWLDGKEIAVHPRQMIGEILGPE